MSQEVPRSWEKLGEEQLKIYAKEMAELYQKEQQLRQELEAKNRELEQRVRELTGLNNFFQQHLNEYFATEEAYQKLVIAIHKMAEAMEQLLRQADEHKPGRTGFGKTAEGQ